MAALRARDFAAAGQALTAAYRRQPGPESLCALGALAAAQEQLLAAQDLYRRCLAEDSPDSPGAAARDQEARPILAQPRPLAGEAAIVGDRGAWVVVDEQLVGQLPLQLPLLLAAGRHTIMVERGRARVSGPVNIRAGRTVELRFSQEGSAILSRMVPALLWLSADTGLPPADKARLSQSVARLVEQEHLALFPSEVALAQAPALASCQQPARCPGEPAAALGIEHIVISRITTPPGAAGQGFDLQLTLIDTAVGGIALELQQSCAQCDGERAAAKLTTMLAELWQKGSGRARGVLAVSSTPPGAELAVDEHVVGTTPYRHPVWAGQHALLLRQPGYAEERTSTNVDSGQTADVSVTLQPVEPPPAVSVAAVAPAPAALPRPARLSRPRWRIVAGSLALLAGGMAAVFGVSALAVSGQCIEPVAMGECRDYYGTRGIGGGLLAGGILVAGAGAVLIALPGRVSAAGAGGG